MGVVAVIPSRGRPVRARRAIDALRRHAVRVDTTIALAVDADDPRLREYLALRFDSPGPEVGRVILHPDETGDLVRATNTVALRIATNDPDSIIGNLGDDHYARTPAWDRIILEALEAPGIAYGDDLLAGARVPTAPFISARIVLALGWYALPTCRHLFIDDAWRDLGEGLGRLVFLPDLVIEHRHPLAGKTIRDAGYDRADAGAGEDLEAYTAWREDEMRHDLERVRDALERPL